MEPDTQERRSPGTNDAGIRCAELMAALSLATDIGMGHPMETGLRVCRVSVLLGDRMGLETEILQRVYYLALLGHIGCTARGHDSSRLIGDEVLMSSHLGTTDLSRPSEAFRFLSGHIGRAYPRQQRPAAYLRVLTHSGAFKEGAIAVCQVARMLGRRLGFDADFESDLDAIYEQWDGRGFPGRLKGEQVTVPAQVVQVSALAVQAGIEGSSLGDTRDLIRQRSGRVLGPKPARAFAEHAGELTQEDADSSWDVAMALEPGAPRGMTEDGVDAALRAAADFVDLKSPYLSGHSSGVAELAARACERFGLPAADVVAARRAGLVHDIGRTGISSGIWGKEGPLSADERERVRLHAYLTDRVLARPAFLKDLGSIASMHHERVDGSGYFRGASGANQAPAARMLGAADVFHAMTEPRPHRPALDPVFAGRELREEVRAGRLDADAVDAVLEAAGQAVPRRREGVAGLTAREVEVLRLVARGRSTKEIARELFIAPKTADAHIQHIYAKADVSTRAAATLFAMQHDLV